jgi:uncharacterized protein YggE
MNQYHVLKGYLPCRHYLDMKNALPVALMLIASCARADQTINVTGDAEIKVPPDEVVLSLGVEVHSKDLAEARRENDRRVRAVKAAAAKSGVQEKDIQTDFIQMGIVYQNDGITPQYYYTRKSIVIALRDVSRMEETLGAAVDAGATHIHGVDFETMKLREYRDQARAMAVKAATEKAHDMAKAAGLQVIGGPINIYSANYGGRSWYGSGWGGMGASAMMAQNVTFVANSGGGGDAGQGTIALGRISVTASVSMQFRIQ